MYEKTWHTGWSYGWTFFLPQEKDEMMGGVGKYFLLSSIKPQQPLLTHCSLLGFRELSLCKWNVSFSIIDVLIYAPPCYICNSLYTTSGRHSGAIPRSGSIRSYLCTPGFPQNSLVETINIRVLAKVARRCVRKWNILDNSNKL
jgi:hypothetical protein